MRFWSGGLLVLLLAVGLGGVTAARADSATQIFASETCVNDRASVSLSWLGVDSAASELSLDLSYQDNGFRDGTFRNSGAISPNLGSVSWDNLPGQRTYFVRLNQIVNGAKDSSRTFFFRTCQASTPAASTTDSPSTSAAVYYGANIDCHIQTCLVDSTAAGTIITVPSLDYCWNHPVECPPAYYYEPANGQIMVYPNLPPSIYARVRFENGHFVPNLQGPPGTTRCNDGFYSYEVGPMTCQSHGGIAQ